MQGISSHGTVIERELDSEGAPGVFTPIGEIGDITMPGLMRNEHETTSHNQDIDSYVLGVLRRDGVQFPIFFNRNDSTHDHLTGLQSAIIENKVDGYKITQPDGAVWIFSGGVQAMNQTAPVDGVQTANVTIRPTGAFLLNGVLVGEEV
jgi:hypothetical protein